MENEHTSNPKTEKLEISFRTDWEYSTDDHKRLAEMRAEKISFYAAAIFELIEMSCEDYIPLSSDEINPSYAHHHLLTIREAAELGKNLVNNQI